MVCCYSECSTFSFFMPVRFWRIQWSIFSFDITHSHDSAIALSRRQCKSMEKAKIRPLAMPKSLNLFSPKLAGMIKSWTAPDMKNFVSIGSGVSVTQIRDFTVLLGRLVFSSFLGSLVRLQPTPLNGFLRQKTLFRVRKCLLGIPITVFYI